MRRLFILAAALLLAATAIPSAAEAGYRRGGLVRSSTGRVHYRRGGYIRSSAPRRFTTTTASISNTIPRRRTERSMAVRNEFRRRTGYPNGRPGYEVDHIKPLFAGGVDATSNMQWLSKSAHRIKTRRDFAIYAR